MTYAELTDALLRRGYLDDDSRRSPNKVEKAVAELQRLYGLNVDGWAGPQTQRVLSDPLANFCGVPDRLPIGRKGQLCKWPHKEITWAFEGGDANLLPSLDGRDQLYAFEWAWKAWATVCGIEPAYSMNPKTANVVISAGGIDRGGGTLAWSELACGTRRDSQRRQKYDSQETWVIKENPARQEIDLARVAAHEIGHVLGIAHLRRGALMQPSYDPQIRRPQTADIVEAVRRYGEPTEGPEPDAGAELPGVLSINGTRYERQAA